MQLLKYILIAFTCVNCKLEVQNSVNYTQQLLFGSDLVNKRRQHWCDIKIKPSVNVTDATIFKKVGTEKDSAVPQFTVIPKKSPITPNAFRIDIPDMPKEALSSKYTFQFTITNDFSLYSEAFTFCKSTNLFCLVSGVKENGIFTKNNLIIAGLSVLVAVVLIALGIVIYRKMCAKKTNL